MTKADGEKGPEEIYELIKASESMKPMLVFFNKPKDLLAFGSKSRKDPEVEACEEMDKDLWKRFAITERAKEFDCIRVNTRKADTKLLRKHRVARAPVVAILDFNLRQVFFSSSPKLSYNTLGKWMDRSQKRVEAEVKKLAKSKDTDDPMVQRAKKRVLEIEQREAYSDGAEQLNRQRYDHAEKKFKEAIEIKAETEWKKLAQDGLQEIKANQMLEEAEKLYKFRRYEEAKKQVEKAIKECPRARYAQAALKEMLKKVKSKLD